MKKFITGAVTAAMVLSMATMSLAATLSYSGKVSVELNSRDGFVGAEDDVYMTVDYAKDFGEGWSAGVKFDVKPNEGTLGDSIYIDGTGYIKYTEDMWDVSFNTDADYSVGNDLSDQFTTLDGTGPGLEVNVKPMEGFTLTGDLAQIEKDDALKNSDADFGYAVKGEYNLDGVVFGAGYLGENNADRAAFGIYGSYAVNDMITVGAEYGDRTVNGNDHDTAIMGKVSYTADPLTANLSYTQRNGGYAIKDDTEGEVYVLADRFWDDNIAADGYLVCFDMSYSIDENLKLVAAVDYTDMDFNKVDNGDTVNIGYKAAVVKTIVPNVDFELGYKSFMKDKVYATISAEF